MKKRGMKRLAALGLALWAAVHVLFSGCVRSLPPSPAGLLRALEKAAPRFSFPLDGLLRSGETWYAFYSLASSNDLLLTLKTDAAGAVRRASLTAARPSEAAALLPFFGETLYGLLYPAGDARAMAEKTGLSAPALTPGEQAGVFEQERWVCVLFTGEHSVSFWITDKFFEDPY